MTTTTTTKTTTNSITEDTTLGELAVHLAKNGVQLCQVSIMPDGSRQCDLADHEWARGHGSATTIEDAIDLALANLREQLALLAGADPNNPVSLDK